MEFLAFLHNSYGGNGCSRRPLRTRDKRNIGQRNGDTEASNTPQHQASQPPLAVSCTLQPLPGVADLALSRCAPGRCAQY